MSSDTLAHPSAAPGTTGAVAQKPDTPGSGSPR